MSVVDVKPDWEGFRSEMNGDSITGQAVYTVLFDDNDDPSARCFLAQTAPGIPRLYTSNPGNRWLYAANIAAVVKRGPFLYEVTVQYNGWPADPITIPPVWSWPQSSTMERIDEDINGDPITNSAGEPSDPPLTEEVHEMVGRVTFCRASFNAVTAWEYRGAVNSDVFQGFPAGKVKCTQYTGEEITTPYGPRYQITMEFHARWDGWKKRFRDEGYEEKIGVKPDGKPRLRHIMVEDLDGNMVKATSPQPLDGSGLQLDDGATAVFREYQTYREMAFSALGLG
jgi:hypothetical protein